MNAPRNLAVLFAGGGTGGHIFPCIAIHEQLASLSPPGTLHARYLCSTRTLDAEILRGASLPFTPIPAQPFALRPRGLIRFVSSWTSAVSAARTAIRELRASAGANSRLVMVATGGFVSAPAARAGVLEGVPVVLVNLDAVPGRANRWISKRAARTLTSARVHAGPGTTWTLVPPIVRAAALAPGSTGDCRTRLGLDENTPTLLVTGASQGARSINQLLIHHARHHTDALRPWQVLHQTGGEKESDAVRDAYRDAGIRAIVQPFVSEMGLWWGAAELAVGRCGAGIVAEAWANSVPAIFLPYPYHRDQHQRANAQPLEAAGAAHIAGDLIEPAANAAGVGATLLSLLESAPRRQAMRKAYASLGPADGAARVAQVVLSL
ncbi:MAG: UDP-N-acetylglucosamine--N-acetylmuramyl-(pentapeptide) pyrophosphoryl-undecaprenol N-acetylglucosamine transferase [Planctomycetota bacterium]